MDINPELNLWLNLILRWVHIFAAMEPCAAFTPWHDKATGKTTLRYKDGKCLHYYFDVMDEEFGLCYLRVPTWAPFRLQFYCNGHNWLARQLATKGDGQQLGPTEFEVRNGLHRLGAQVLAAALEQRKKGGIRAPA